jgi:hypothetical protein
MNGPSDETRDSTLFRCASQAELKRWITFVEQELQVSKRSCAPPPSFDLKEQSTQSIVGQSYPLKCMVYGSILTSMHPSLSRL